MKQNQIEELKTPPHSKEAEQAVLGGLLLDPRGWDKIADRLSANDFYIYSHRLIFHSMQNLFEHNIARDAVTICQHLKDKKILEDVGSEVYLYQLQHNTPAIANLVSYADIVKQKSILRQLIASGQDIVNLAFDSEHPANELVDQAEQKIFKISEQHKRGDGPIKITALLTSAAEKIDELYHSKNAITGLSTGFIDLDKTTCGLQRGDLIIVAGRPSMGKTAFAMNIAEYAAIKSQKPILVFSMEMPGESLTMRLISSLGRIDQNIIRTGKLLDNDWQRVTTAISLLSQARLFIDDTPALSPNELRARARRLARAEGELGLIVIDYLQLMQVPGHKENRTQEISEISRALKILAKELNVPVLALSQLNRGLEQRQDRRPIMSDLRESGAIEQDADLITFIYRDEVYNDNSPDRGTAEIIIAKQRNGPIGKIRLTFLGQYTRFENFI